MARDDRSSCDTSSQRDRFEQAARELGVELDEASLRATLRIVAQPKAVSHASDCALHNAPAYEPGNCDCGAL